MQRSVYERAVYERMNQTTDNEFYYKYKNLIWAREKECGRVLYRLCGPHIQLLHDKEQPWLKNEITGKCLRPDWYLPALKLAVEHHGEQHYMISKFARTTQKLRYIKLLDSLKAEGLHKHGDVLIVVPYDIPWHEIQNYIISQIPVDIMQKILDSSETTTRKRKRQKAVVKKYLRRVQSYRYKHINKSIQKLLTPIIILDGVWKQLNDLITAAT